MFLPSSGKRSSYAADPWRQWWTLSCTADRQRPRNIVQNYYAPESHVVLLEVTQNCFPGTVKNSTTSKMCYMVLQNHQWYSWKWYKTVFQELCQEFHNEQDVLWYSWKWRVHRKLMYKPGVLCMTFRASWTHKVTLIIMSASPAKLSKLQVRGNDAWLGYMATNNVIT